MLSNLMDHGEPLSTAVGNHLYVLYCFTSCPPSAGHINQTAMGGILIRVLINLTATFTDQPFALSWRWTSPQFHLSSLLHLANHRDVAQSSACSDTCLVCILLLLILCLCFICWNAHILQCSMLIWTCALSHMLMCSVDMLLFFYSPISNISYVLVLYAGVLIS